MIISLNDQTGAVNENFLQSLVLLYMPCESFSLSDKSGNTMEVAVSAENGICSAKIKISCCGKSVEFSDTSEFDGSRLAVKNLVGKVFLAAAEKIFGYKSPWGIVTGIRPAKLAADYLKKYTPEQTAEILTDKYFVNPKRADICVRTAINEMNLTKDLQDKTCSLYVSIPFCPSKCKYCSFVSSATPRLLSLIPEYLLQLQKDIVLISESVRELGLKLESVYVGGGTPAVLDELQIEKLLNCINESFDITPDTEFTFEAGRPDCITQQKLKAVYNAGVSRISINTQTTNNDILRSVGRKHTYEDYLKCMYLAKDIGIKCINTDLIAGLPGESAESFRKSVQDVIAVSPENITVHSFTLKRSSEYKTTHSASVDSASSDALDMVEYAAESAIKSGYEPYYMYRQKNTVGNLDNTGYAKPGTASLYNVYMMGEYHTVFGAGAGSVTKYVSGNRTRIERVFAPKYPYEYLDKEKYSGFDKDSACEFYSKLY